MEGSYRDKYSFIAEWYDNQASILRRYYLFFYPIDDSLEMHDIKGKRRFMRRSKVNGINLQSFFLGCTLNINGRLIKIVDFACENTRNKLYLDLQTTFAYIKPLPLHVAGKIITHFYKNGLRISKMKQARLTGDDVATLHRTMLMHATYPFLLDYLTGSKVIGIELVGKNAVNKLLEIVGDLDPTKAEPGTIRALYGSDPVRNCVHAAPNVEEACFYTDYFFPPPHLRHTRLRLTDVLSNCTLCIVKPHAIREGKLGSILEAIDNGGFDVTALHMLMVETINAAEFYEVYKGIVPEYKGMVEELSSGQCVAMEVVAKEKNVNSAIKFRKLVGPSDPDIARLLRPDTLRAKFGNNKIQNAVHCSDLAEDGLLEVEYFFKILDL